MQSKKVLVVFCLLVVTVILLGVRVRNEYWRGEKYKTLIEELTKRGFSERYLRYLFSSREVKFYSQIPRIFQRTRKSRKNPYLRFLSDVSVSMGKDFLTENDSLLSRVEHLYKVPKEVLVALLRVESRFGKNCGRYQAFGALNSIIYFSKDSLRVEWAKKELLNLLILCRQIGKNPLYVKSSYAGALGWCQFLPSSYLLYGIDGDSDGVVNLWSLPDAVYSIGFYLASHRFFINPRKAVFSYNHSTYFVDYVFKYAQKLKKTMLVSK